MSGNRAGADDSTPSAITTPAGYSKAFEQIVQHTDDVIGLLAYSLYKKMIRQRSQQGLALPKNRDLMQVEVDLYRDKADSYLQLLAAAAVKAERPNILNEQILKDVRRATGFWYPGVVIGIVAWLLSLAITLLVTSQAPEGLVRWALPYLNPSHPVAASAPISAGQQQQPASSK